MVDEKQPDRMAMQPAPPKGIAFDIADLLQAQSWARYHDRPMRIRLDHAVDGEEYEEVIELYPGPGARSKLLIWRGRHSMFVQPLPGRKQRFCSMDAALRSLGASKDIAVTDSVATSWQAGPRGF